MATEDWQRVGQDVLAQMSALGLNRSKVQKQAPVDNKTLQSVIEGARQPSLDVQSKIEKVLGWAPGEMSRRARGAAPDRPLEGYRDAELLSELLQRALRREVVGGDTAPTTPLSPGSSAEYDLAARRGRLQEPGED